MTLMTLNELSNALKQMYDTAPAGEQAAMIHLFGIRYAKEIQASDYSPRDIVHAANMSANYASEIYKGMRLSRYVKERCD